MALCLRYLSPRDLQLLCDHFHCQSLLLALQYLLEEAGFSSASYSISNAAKHRLLWRFDTVCGDVGVRSVQRILRIWVGFQHLQKALGVFAHLCKLVDL